jgi:hypothetical protein
VTARRLILAFFAVELLTWALSFVGVGGHEPPPAYLVTDVALGTLLFVGLWLRLRVAWWVLTVETFGGLLLSIVWLIGGRNVSAQVVLIVGGLAELALLMAPPLRPVMRYDARAAER